MKNPVILLSMLSGWVLIMNCSHAGKADEQEVRIDSLKQLVELLKPGLGEFMMQFEYHHTKLSKTIAEKKYDQVAYEIDEIREVAEKIEKLKINNDKLKAPFSTFYDKFLKSALDALGDADTKKNDQALQTNLIALTNNCNSCHNENNMSFMKIQP